MSFFRSALLLFALFAAALTAKSQVLQYNINCTSQFTIDNLEANFGPFTGIEGDLLIGAPDGQNWL